MSGPDPRTDEALREIYRTHGGIETALAVGSQIPDTLRSKIVDALYQAGELGECDWDSLGPCGTDVAVSEDEAAGSLVERCPDPFGTVK